MKKPPGMTDDVWEQLQQGDPEERLDAVAIIVAQMYGMLVDEAPPPKGTKKKIPKGLSKAVGEAQAHRARVGKAAKRNGMTYEEWVNTYGMVDKNPDGEREAG